MSSKSNLYFQLDNISSLFFKSTIAMIFIQLTGVVAEFIDGIVASQFLGEEAYAGISLLRPFYSVVLVLAVFLSTGCIAVCSRLVTQGRQEEAGGVFSLSALLSLGASAVLIVFCVVFPMVTLRLCGVPLLKYPDLIPYMNDYLHGFLIGIVPLMLIQVIGPVLVMDGGKWYFIVSSIILCTADIIGDLLSVTVFRGGAFGLGIATSIGYVLQLLILLLYLFMKKGCFRPSLKGLGYSFLNMIARLGTPALTKKLSSALRDITFNYVNIIVALSYFAITARGIQSDLYLLLFCIPSGMGRTLIIMSGIYYRAEDRHGLQTLYAYALRLGARMSIATGAVFFIAAPLLTRLYTEKPEVASLSVFAIRWVAVGLIFDTSIVLLQSYFQGTGSTKASNSLIVGELFLIPVVTAFLLGMLFGSKGVLASIAVSKIILMLAIFVVNCIRCHGIPKAWKDVMLLPDDFGGAETDNIYAEIRTMDDVILESKRAYDFCLQHDTGGRVAGLISLFIEEMAGNVVGHAKKTGNDSVCVNFRLFAKNGRICITIMDLCERFDPSAFYELYHDEAPEKHIGIRMVMSMAEEVRYYNTFNSNNLTIYLAADAQ